MDSRTKQWTGEEWQAYALDILLLHYGPNNFQRVPDENRGDLGIEAFTREGCAFQCYAPQEPLSIRARYKRHRTKLSADIRKLIENRCDLQRILGDTVLHSWIFMVPNYDSKELLAHAAAKTAAVRSKGLPYIRPDFRILVHDDNDYPAARNTLLATGVQALNLEPVPATDESISTWALQNDPLVKIVDTKLLKLKLPSLSTEERRTAFRTRLVARWIEGQDVMERLRSLSPELFEKIFRCKATKERALAMRRFISTDRGTTMLNSALKDYVATLESEVKALSEGVRNDLGWEAVSDWLFRCPLDFPDVAHD